MSADAWEEIQAIKSKRNSLRERLEKRKKERQDILGSSLGTASPVNLTESIILHSSANVKEEHKVKFFVTDSEDLVKVDPELEQGLLKELSEVTLQLPVSSSELLTSLKLTSDRDATHKKICNLLEKFAIQKLVTIKSSKDGISALEVLHVEVSKVNAMILECIINKPEISRDVLKRKRDDSPDKSNENEEERKRKEKKEPKADIMVNINILYYQL
ncbi:hypothetical protein NQ314_013569 [Rhamnusium bicolor]|uniref:Uncharacterized protein n=1 Tax=Rhamnusium bicolor TaxID=1586634 RepID=A0AAV8X5T3_9CUCU|nr:hypothetical protein NQ314_013569 [Rhamnusium bicolor]